MATTRTGEPSAPGSGAPFEFDRFGRAELATRRGAKWGRARHGELCAWVADMDFPVAPAIRDALAELLERDELGYPDDRLAEEVRGLFAERMADRYGLVLDPALTLALADVVQAMHLALLTLTEPGDGVVFLTPTYPPFFSAVSDTGRTPVAVDLVAGRDRYEIDFDALRARIESSRARCLLLCNPHNPTGRAFSLAELTALAEIALAHDLVVVSDEIHADLVLPGATHVPIGRISPEVAARTVTLYSASKAFNVAGLRCALAGFGSAALAERFAAFPAHARGEVGVPGLLAARAAWRSGEAWLTATLAELDANRGRVGEQLAGVPLVGYRPPEATYLAWLDLRRLRLGDDPAVALERDAGLIVSSGPSFGEAGRGHVRVNFATPRAVLEELLERLRASLAGRA